MAAPAPAFDVVLVSDDAPDLPARAARALAGLPHGRVALQLRRPELGAGALLALAHALRAITREHGALLLVNDRVDVALLAEADGVQLPERSLAADAARTLLPAHALIGVSHHAPDRAVAPQASFALVSPVYDVPGKAPPIGVEGLGRAIRAAGVPVYALGGVTSAHIPALRAVGVRGIAAIRAVWGAPEPRAALADMLARFDEPLPDVAAAGVRG